MRDVWHVAQCHFRCLYIRGPLCLWCQVALWPISDRFPCPSWPWTIKDLSLEHPQQYIRTGIQTMDMNSRESITRLQTSFWTPSRKPSRPLETRPMPPMTLMLCLPYVFCASFALERNASNTESLRVTERGVNAETGAPWDIRYQQAATEQTDLAFFPHFVIVLCNCNIQSCLLMRCIVNNSGPRRYDLEGGQWVCRRAQNETLRETLERELSLLLEQSVVLP